MAKNVELADFVLKYAPHDSNIYYKKGEALEHLGRYEEAIDSYSLALKYNSSFKREKCYNLSMIYYDLGNCYAVLKQYERALGFYNLSVEHGRDDRYVYYGIEDMLFKLGRLGKESD
jgi:tetratricopeptide (TPR) repeat protein